MFDFDSLLVRNEEGQESIKLDMKFSSRMLEAGVHAEFYTAKNAEHFPTGYIFDVPRHEVFR